MKKLLILLYITLLCYSGCVTIYPKPEPIQEQFIVSFDEPELDVYRIAAGLTGCPERILRGIAFAESTYNQDAIGDDGLSMGRFQINENYHAYYAGLWGEYNPMCPLDTAILTGRIYMKNLAELGTEMDAIAAHRQGASGVRLNGRAQWYVERVLTARS